MISCDPAQQGFVSRLDRSTLTIGLSLAVCLVLCPVLASAQSLALPHNSSGISLNSTLNEASFEIDAATLPARANMVISVVPDPAHSDLELEIEVDCTWISVPGSGCNEDINGNPFTYFSSSTFPPGAAELEAGFVSCNPFSPFIGETCEVTVRALDFGAAGSPAIVDVEIRGITSVPFSTFELEFDPAPQPDSIELSAFRDTTLYSQDVSWSNGLGQSIWAGRNYLGGGPFSFTFSTWHGMVGFDLNEPIIPVPGKIPPGATIVDAVLTMSVLQNSGPITSVTLSPVVDSNSPITMDEWNAGDADAPFDEQSGVVSTISGADWDHRRLGPSSFWNTPGAATGPVAAVSFAPSAGGQLTFNSAALTAEVARQYTERDDGLGFQLRNGTFTSIFPTDQAVRLASSEHPTPSLRPQLTVSYTPAFPEPVSGALQTGALSFIGEGQNFRWIYDDNDDDILFTEIGGKCIETAEFEGGGLFFVPYTYEYSGDPNYQGLDCCTWKIESAQTETVGVGQAIFYLDLDASLPANQPGDIDADGIVDLCDNCPYTPNGPTLGSCIADPGPNPSGAVQVCNSDLDCDPSETCSLSQEDDDFTFPGIACPEPGFGLALGFGTWALAFASGRRRDKWALESHRGED